MECYPLWRLKTCFVCDFLGPALRRSYGWGPGTFSPPCIDVDHGVYLQAGLAMMSGSAVLGHCVKVGEVFQLEEMPNNSRFFWDGFSGLSLLTCSTGGHGSGKLRRLI